MPAFAVLICHSRLVRIDGIQISDSGSHAPKGWNNTTGGILLEEGVADFEIRNCTLRSIRGNGIWTHSIQMRNAGGLIAGNTFQEIGRDAIQVGHATRIRVESNRGSRIGFPASEIDVDALATPVGIDTAGNVDASVYQDNHFEEVNGKCFDLDGFHDGAVRNNTCVNRGAAGDYSWGNFGIVLNNANPDMESRNVVIEGNRISGLRFGAIFLIGSAGTVRNNYLTRLNLAHCPENARFGCDVRGQPGLTESGIYLASRGERPSPARGNLIEDNVIRGWKMKTHCIGFAPGARASDNTIRRNECSDE